MSKTGYNKATISANKEADGKKLGVQVGRACIKFDVSVTKAAKLFGVSRQAVYNWFCGLSDIPSTRRDRVTTIMDRIKNS